MSSAEQCFPVSRVRSSRRMSSVNSDPDPPFSLPDPLLQQGPQHGIGPGDRKVQVAGREDDGGALLVEAHGQPGNGAGKARDPPGRRAAGGPRSGSMRRRTGNAGR